MSQDAAVILKLPIDSLSLVFARLTAVELTRLFLTGSRGFRHRLLTNGAVRTLRISMTREHGTKLVRRYESFPTVRGAQECSDGLLLPIVFRFPTISSFIVDLGMVEEAEFERYVGALASVHDWRCLVALPPTLTHLEFQLEHALLNLESKEALEYCDSENGVVSLRRLFPELRTLIVGSCDHRSLINAFTLRIQAGYASNGPLRTGRIFPSSAGALFPPNLTDMVMPLQLSPTGSVLLPASLTRLKLFWKPSTSALGQFAAKHGFNIHNQENSPAAAAKLATEAKEETFLAHFRTLFAGVTSLTTWTLDPVSLSIFGNLTELRILCICDAATAALLPRTLTTFSVGFDRYCTYGKIVRISAPDPIWISVVEALPSSVTRLELAGVEATQASEQSDRSSFNPLASPESQVVLAGGAVTSWPNPFPPKMRSLRLKFRKTTSLERSVKELGDCNLAELLPTISILDELRITHSKFDLLAPYPRLVRLSVHHSDIFTFSSAHWKLLPALTELDVSRMSDTALSCDRKDFPSNLVRVHTTTLFLTGSLLKRHDHPLPRIAPRFIVEDARKLKLWFSFTFAGARLENLVYWPPSAESFNWLRLTISSDLISTYLLASLGIAPPEGKADLLPSINSLSLRCHPDKSLYAAKLIEDAWSLRTPISAVHPENRFSLTIGALVLLPASIKRLSHLNVVINLDKDLPLLSTHWSGIKRLHLAKGAIFKALFLLLNRRLDASLVCTRLITKEDLHFFPREVEALHVESTFTNIAVDDLTAYFHSLTELHLDRKYNKLLKSMVHLTSLRKITYHARYDKLLGLPCLPPSVTAIDLFLSKGSEPSLWPYKQPVLPKAPLPWPQALRNLRVRVDDASHEYLEALPSTLPKDTFISRGSSWSFYEFFLAE